MKHLISRAELAERAGVSQQAIGQLTREGRKLHAALVGDKIDAGHPDVKIYLRSKGVSTTFRAPARPEHTEVEGAPDDGTPQAMVDLQQLRLCELSDRFGGEPELSNWLKALQTSEDVRGKRLKNDEFEKALISRELVQTHVMGALDEAFRRLLSDATKTITRQLYANARAGLEIEKSEAEVRSIVSKTLEPVKKKAARTLRAE